MASQTPGIQQLLLAEKKASEKVGEARKGKLPLSYVDCICFQIATKSLHIIENIS